MPGEAVGKLYYREGMSGAEQLLFDPTHYMSGKILTLQSILPSYDGKKIAIAYSAKGAEVSTIIVMDVDTKTFLKDSIYPSRGAYSWTFDNKSFFYNWLRSADNKDPQARLNSKTRLHVIGTDMSGDIDFFSNEIYPELKIAPNLYPYAGLNEDSKNYIFSTLGSVQPEFQGYYAPIQTSGKIGWKALCTYDDKIVRGMETIGDDVYAITYKDAKNYKLIHTNLQHVDWANAGIIAAEKPDQTLESFTYSKDYLYLTYSDGINDHLSKYNLTTKIITDVKLPFSGTFTINCINKKSNRCYVSITSWIRPFTEFDYNAEIDNFAPGNFNKPPQYPAAYNDMQVKEVEVKGHDGGDGSFIYYL